MIPHVPHIGHEWPLRWMWIVMLLCLASSWHDADAQPRSFDATNLREPTQLAEGWLIHAGDDPVYSRPNFDDSNWIPFNAQTGDLHDLFPHQPEVVWYRLHIKVAPNQTGLAFLEQTISQAFEVYSNGVRLIQAGRVRPFVAYNTNAQLLAPIPDDQITTGSLIVALRVHISAAEWSFPGGAGFSSTNLILGMGSTLRENAWFSAITTHALDWLDYALNICLLLGGVMLYSTQRKRLEYLWLSLWAGAWLSVAPLELYSLFQTFPLVWYALNIGILCFLGLYSVARMYCAFVGHQVGWRLLAYVAVSAAGMYFANIAFIFGLTLNVQLLASVPFVLFFAMVLPFIVVRGVGRGRSAERLLLLPVLLIGVYFVIRDCAELMSQVPALRDRSLRFLSMAFGTRVGPFHLDYYYLSDLLAKLSLALIILIRSNRMSRQQALLESEIASAREVQQVILPEAHSSFPGIVIESEYRPAREVGGDFFQIVPCNDGGVLVIAGDVTGKGLKAGMLVALLVGAIRSTADWSTEPLSILQALNQRLLGRRDAQATCLALRIERDGNVRLANAGHLAPYLNGEPIKMDGALPLGMMDCAEFSLMNFKLGENDRLVLVSDGVIEATDANGNLFGFERVHHLLSTVLTAAEVANAAQKFGQEDDISVISVTRTPVLNPAPA